MSQSGPSHLDVIARLRTELSRIMDPLTENMRRQPYALLDFPNHSNVGDSAIFAGEIAWLKARFGRNPAWVNELGTPPEQDLIPQQGPIYLHGGGNFGDIYPRHQDFREAVLARHPGRPVIQLAQSLHYSAPDAASNAARAIATHGDFVLLVRDTPSLDFAHARFDCPVQLCPDFAFALGPINRPAPPHRDVLLLLRNDPESVSPAAGHSLPQGWDIEDWLDEPADTFDRARRAKRWGMLRSLDPRVLSAGARRVAFYNALSGVRVARGLDQLASARYVITDRLHAHILCTLMGIPHAFLDNSYGKIARYSEAFGTCWNGVTRAGDMADAIGAAQDHLAGMAAA